MIVSEKMKPATFKHVEAELYAFPRTKKEIKKRREEILNPFDEDPEDISIVKGAQSVRQPGRPTERIATRLTMDKLLRNMEEIVEAICEVYERADENHRKMMKLAYWSNKRYTWQRIADECHVHKNTMTKMRREIVYMVADRMGWH